MNKILNNKWVMYLGQLSPLFLNLIYFTNWHVGIKIGTSLLVFFYYLIIFFSIRNDSDYILFPKYSKTIYSKYGSHLICLVTNSEKHLEFGIFRNKRIFWLERVDPSPYGNTPHGVTYVNKETFKTEINERLDKNLSIEYNRKMRKKEIRKWDGSMDIITNRNKNIDEIISN